MAVETFEAHDPRTGRPIQSYTDADDREISLACSGAAKAASALRDGRARVGLLRIMARRLRHAAEALHELCERETGLPRARLEGELERTCVQLELFAAVVEEGSHVAAIIDTADPDAPVAPRPDLRRMLVPLGPAAIFAASNFPYAFSVAGGDTASALAAGCPVVVKAHPSHPGTSDAVMTEFKAALEAADVPTAAISLLHGAAQRVGKRLVQAPAIKAVGFTGSIGGGRALFDVAARRARPIPVYAEMGSVNPILITSAALRARAAAIADGLASAVVNGTGQFCTKPGIVLVPKDAEGTRFIAAVADRLDTTGAGPLLNARIHAAFQRAISQLDDLPGVERVTAPSEVSPGSSGYLHAPTGYTVDAAVAITWPDLLEERFGPTVILLRYGDEEEASAVLDILGGQLTAAVHAQPEELGDLHEILARMQEKAGRIIFDGFPTGVAVTHAMQHGGPYPAATAPAHTSVGTMAIRRFQRPVAWQNAPAEALPAALRDENPVGIWRLINGRLTRDPV